VTRAWPAAAGNAGSVFAFGGVDIEGMPTQSAERLSSGAWSGIAAMPGARFMQAAAVVNGVVYVVGGRDANYQPAADCFAYDTNTDTWQTLASMATARYGAAAAALGGQVWVIGGFGGAPVASVERFTP